MKKLKEYRLDFGYTLKEVAKMLDITESSVCLHENGDRTPDIKTIKKYAEIYKCTVDDLIKEDC